MDRYKNISAFYLSQSQYDTLCVCTLLELTAKNLFDCFDYCEAPIKIRYDYVNKSASSLHLADYIIEVEIFMLKTEFMI